MGKDHPNVTHGHSLKGKKTDIYQCWENMKRRCNYPKSPSYKNYGARGIKVCKRWDKFENFLADMGEPPKGLTIDRIDNDGDYEPGNCRWATHKQQAGNTTRSVWIENGGERQIKADWLREVGVNGNVWDKIKNRHDFTESETLNHFMENRGPM